MVKFTKQHYIISLILVTALTFLIWHRSLNQAFTGEGATYLTEPFVSMLSKEGLLGISNRHDVFSILFTTLVSNYFRDQIWLYYLSMLIIVSSVNYLLYLLVVRVTGKWFMGAISVSFFAANYVGSFQKLGQGYYQWFIQRIPQFIPALLGLILMINFYANKRKIYYYGSVFFYLLAFFLSHYTLIILPLFLIYPLAYVFVNNRKNLKQYGLAFVQTIPFVLGSYLLLRNQDLNSSQIQFNNQLNSEVGIIYFLQHQPWFKELLKEITIMIVPLNPVFHINLANLYAFSIPISLGLLAMFLLVYRKVNNSVRPLLLTSAVALLLVTFIVMYINPGAVFFHPGISRYLYTPSMVFAIFLGIVIGWVLEQKMWIKTIVIILITLWTINSIQLINKGFDSWQPTHNIVLATVEYVRNNHSNFPEKSVIVTEPVVGGFDSSMLEHFYGGEQIWVVHYDSSLPERLKVRKQQYNKVVFLKYKDKKIKPIIKDIEDVINGLDTASLFKK